MYLETTLMMALKSSNFYILWYYPKAVETIGNTLFEIFIICPKIQLYDFRFGFFVLKQPSFLDYSQEGGPTDNCSPLMSAGRGPYRSTKEFIKKYGLRLVAATFLIIDTSTASVEIACEWQQCMGGEVFLADLDCTVTPPRLRRKK